jgi:hypothetical protein
LESKLVLRIAQYHQKITPIWTIFSIELSTLLVLENCFWRTALEETLMKFKLQLHVLTDDNAIECTEDIATFDKDYGQLADLGLNLAESKQLLAELQRQFVGQQTGAYLNDHRYCRHCDKKLAIKDYSPVNFRSLFGTVVLRSPRLY